ncbi:MAG TPA: NusA-like transcription termination signal-binding factor [Methanocorpusculum sp.]|jgi:N utilization substance protein A|nr:NusA-like transcription termination signal-binding factor [Methanocorpusculum sp.]MDD2470763.1 NusA-like transcription termination signal-binding factor [Methanocorpusculum sp.]MDD3257310.1 NusA-like transcription termination signal-binding factor [Methanocorpusculum sp.]MDD4132311.1 NusA-like transcription termination signal-binding factor [Methanocorpusculum sp.]HKM41951.1 NusA-like transcription termination signal-binding factor [Methanocorpusculum sp.]
MSEITISEDAMRMIAQFENLTGAGARDCVVDDKFGRILFVINPGEMGLAIGKKGASIKKASDAFGKKVEVVEYNPDKVQFIRNCFLPVHVMTVTFEEEEEENTEVAYIEVAESDRGLAIGKEGRNIIKAKKLAFRQFDIANVELKQEEEEESEEEEEL